MVLFLCGFFSRCFPHYVSTLLTTDTRSDRPNRSTACYSTKSTNQPIYRNPPQPSPGQAPLYSPVSLLAPAFVSQHHDSKAALNNTTHHNRQILPSSPMKTSRSPSSLSVCAYTRGHSPTTRTRSSHEFPHRHLKNTTSISPCMRRRRRRQAVLMVSITIHSRVDR